MLGYYLWRVVFRLAYSCILLRWLVAYLTAASTSEPNNPTSRADENEIHILFNILFGKSRENLVIRGNSISQIQKNSPTKFCHWPDWKENFWNFDYCQIKYWPKKVSHKLLNLKIALLLFPQSPPVTRAIKFCDRMLLHITTNSVNPGSHINIWLNRFFVGYSIHI